MKSINLKGKPIRHPKFKSQTLTRTISHRKSARETKLAEAYLIRNFYQLFQITFYKIMANYPNFKGIGHFVFEQQVYLLGRNSVKYDLKCEVCPLFEIC